MVTSFTSPLLTLSRNSVKVRACSFGELPLFTTANKNTATTIRTTQKINVLILEFTKPPYGPFNFYRRHPGQYRFRIVTLNVSTPNWSPRTCYPDVTFPDAAISRIFRI